MQGAAELRKIFKKLSIFLHSGRGKFTKRKIRLGGRVLSLGRLRYSNGLCLRSQILCLSQVARIKGQYNFHIKVDMLMIQRINLVNDKWRRVCAHYRLCLILVNIWSGHQKYIFHTAAHLQELLLEPLRSDWKLTFELRLLSSSYYKAMMIILLILILQGNDQQNIFDEF